MSVYVLLWLRSLMRLFFSPLTITPLSLVVIPAFLSVIPVSPSVIPAKAGIHSNTANLRLVDSRLRGNDEGGSLKMLKALLG